MKKRQGQIEKKTVRRSTAKRIDRAPPLEKKKVLKYIKDMPETFSLDEIMDKLMLLSRIESAIASSEAGHTVSLDEAMKRHAKWLK